MCTIYQHLEVQPHPKPLDLLMEIPSKNPGYNPFSCPYYLNLQNPAYADHVNPYRK